MQMIEFHAAIFSWFLCSFGPLSRAPVAHHLETGGMTLHDAVGVTVKKAQLLNIKVQVPSIWAKGVCWISVCAIFGHDYPPLIESESNDILLLLLFSWFVILLIADNIFNVAWLVDFLCLFYTNYSLFMLSSVEWKESLCTERNVKWL